MNDDLWNALLNAVQEAYYGMGYDPGQFSAREALDDIHLAALRDPSSIEGQWVALATLEDVVRFHQEWPLRCAFVEPSLFPSAESEVPHEA